MINLAYVGDTEQNNTKGLLFNATFSGTYGVNGVGDLLNLAPSQLGTNPNGITDPKLSYNLILELPPALVGIFSERLGGYYTEPTPNAVPTLQNWGLRMYSPGGVELATGVAYPASVLAGLVVLQIFVPLQ